MQTWNSLACQPKGYGTQVTFKACGLLVVSTCMVSILFVFCLDSRLFNFVWSFLYFIIMVTGYPSIWVEYFFLPLHYHLLFTKLSTNIFCILQVISISLKYSLDSWTLGHFYFCFVCPQNMYIIWYGFKTTQDEFAQF